VRESERQRNDTERVVKKDRYKERGRLRKNKGQGGREKLKGE
jgi:hypothetical protein